jgi:hypothetical protein
MKGQAVQNSAQSSQAGQAPPCPIGASAADQIRSQAARWLAGGASVFSASLVTFMVTAFTCHTLEMVDPPEPMHETDVISCIGGGRSLHVSEVPAVTGSTSRALILALHAGVGGE